MIFGDLPLTNPASRFQADLIKYVRLTENTLVVSDTSAPVFDLIDDCCGIGNSAAFSPAVGEDMEGG